MQVYGNTQWLYMIKTQVSDVQKHLVFHDIDGYSHVTVQYIIH